MFGLSSPLEEFGSKSLRQGHLTTGFFLVLSFFSGCPQAFRLFFSKQEIPGNILISWGSFFQCGKLGPPAFGLDQLSKGLSYKTKSENRLHLKGQPAETTRAELADSPP